MFDKLFKQKRKQERLGDMLENHLNSLKDVTIVTDVDANTNLSFPKYKEDSIKVVNPFEQEEKDFSYLYDNTLKLFQTLNKMLLKNHTKVYSDSMGYTTVSFNEKWNIISEFKVVLSSNRNDSDRIIFNTIHHHFTYYKLFGKYNELYNHSKEGLRDYLEKKFEKKITEELQDMQEKLNITMQEKCFFDINLINE